MQIAEDKYCPIGTKGQRIDSFLLQVHLLCLDACSTCPGKTSGLIQRPSRSVAASHLQPFPGEKYSIAAVTASKI